MNRDDIIRMAREASLCDANGEDDDSVNIADQLERFTALVAAAEREAIIQMMPGGHSVDPQWVCDAIRARRNT